jgi:antitoxin (DNA-binding transcriptional repressor) of toxin-antitoxin stability system
MSKSPQSPKTVREVATGGYLSDMRSVGIKVLKNRLSEYLRMVTAGETILVTDRDRVVAELRPPSLAHPLLADALFADMVARGVLTLPTVREGPLPPRQPLASLEEILAGLDADRADR